MAHPSRTRRSRDETIRSPSRRDQITNIRTLAQEGISKEEIASVLGLSVSTIRGYASQGQIEFIGGKHKLHFISDAEIARRIRTALREEVSDLEELTRYTHCGKSRILTASKQYHIALPESLTYSPSRPAMDVLIAQGFSLGDIGEHETVNLTRERVRQYINSSGQYSSWKKRRTEFKAQKKERQLNLQEERKSLLSLLEMHIEQLAAAQGWHYQKALEYLKQSNYDLRTFARFETYAQFLDNYQYAKEREVQLSLRELVEGLDLSPTGANLILKKLKLEPLYGNYSTHSRTETKKRDRLVQQVLGLGLSARDIGYFLDINLNATVVYSSLPSSRQPVRCYRTIKSFWAAGPLTYRTASQIYEGLDAGFTSEETAYLLDKKQVMVDYAVQHRTEIEPTLLKALHILFPEEKSTTPYRIKTNC